MLPVALLAGGIWLHNGITYLKIRNRRNQLRRREQDEQGERSLTVFHNCRFEDKRTFNFNHYENCTFNNYHIHLTIRRNDDDE